MREMLLLTTIFVLGISCTEDLVERNQIKTELAKDLQGHLDYLLTVVPANNTAVRDFLLMEAKVAGDFERGWYDRRSSILKFLEQDRKVQEWLKEWRSDNLEEAADYFINAAENFKTNVDFLEMKGSEIMKSAYGLLYNPSYKSSPIETKRSLVLKALTTVDPCAPGNFCDLEK